MGCPVHSLTGKCFIQHRVLVATAALVLVPRGQGWVRLVGDSVGENQQLLSVLFLLDG